MNEMQSRQARRRARKREIRRKRIRFFLILLVLFAAILSAVIAKNRVSVPKEEPTAESNIQQEETQQPSELKLFPQPAEKEADLLKAIKVADGIRTCYLTFDDGPTTSVTPKILDTLRRYQVKATFFMVGSLIEENPDMARRVYDEGHLLANHSYSHSYSKLYADGETFMNELNKTYELIGNVTGKTVRNKVFRFPGGGYNAGTWGANKQTYKGMLADANIYYCDWNALNGDAEGGGKKSAAELLARIKNTTGAEDVVILMHDAAAKATTAEALPDVIEYLMGQGFIFKTLAEV